MAPKIDALISPAEQRAWIEGPRRDGAEGLRPRPLLGDEKYDDRLKALVASTKWPYFQKFLRFYIENCILQPYKTQPSEIQIGWWNITITKSPQRAFNPASDELSELIHMNVWQQSVLSVDFRFDAEGAVRGYLKSWLDKATVAEAAEEVAGLSSEFVMDAPTSLKGKTRELTKLVGAGAPWETLAEICDSPWFVTASRLHTLDLMRAGRLVAGHQRHHVHKLVDCLFAEPAAEVDKRLSLEQTLQSGDAEFETQVRSWFWRRKNTHLFVEPVLRNAGRSCQLSGVTTPALLQACHIKPFAECADQERLDPENGLCLALHIHAAFDAHLIGVKPDGSVVYSDALTEDDRSRMNLPRFAKLNLRPGQNGYVAERFERYLESQRSGVLLAEICAPNSSAE